MKAKIIELLSGVCRNVSHFYPARTADAPCVVWHESEDKCVARADGKDYLYEYSCEIEIFACSAKECDNIFAIIDARFGDGHLTRVSSVEGFDSKTRLHTRKTTYKILHERDD